MHLIGDYITQNHWMAINKTENSLKGYLACFIHVAIYSLPFLFIASFNAFLIIFISHFLVDKYRLAIYLIKLKNWEWKSLNFGFSEETPVWLSMWLMIITDNSIHIIINFFTIKYF